MSPSVVDASIEPVTPDDPDPPLDAVAVAREPPARALHRALLGAAESGGHPRRRAGTLTFE